MTPEDVPSAADDEALRQAGVFVRRSFLPPVEMLRLLSVFDRLAASWASSEGLGLLGRGQTGQIRPTSLTDRALFDELRSRLAPAVLQWAKACGFWFPTAPHLQLFPVRMVGDASTPAYQEPHRDSVDSHDQPPICTNVFYARTRGTVGGALAVADARGEDLEHPVLLRPTPNTIVSIAGERVHWVQPLFAGERLSVVINLYDPRR